MQEIDDEFEVKLGRIGNRKAKKATSYLRRVRQEAQKAGMGSRRASSFTGGRIGRGHAHGTTLAGRARMAGRRRVVIKARIVRIKAGDTGAVRAHLRYVQRDGVTRDGQPGDLYGASDRADGKAFTERSDGDRHQFRFIVAPEDSAQLSELKPFVRDLMRQMEQDLGTKLDWVAADHFNTGHPHSHIVIRGKDDQGNDLVIARDYITHGLRARAADLITRELGPETEIEAVRKLQQEVTAERFTRLDRAILRDATDGGLELAAKPARDPVWHATRMGRLRTLERMGLAEENTPGNWQIDAELEAKLRRLGERGDIIKTMHRELATAGIARAAGTYAIFDPERAGQRLVGRVVGEGFADELSERRYVVLDGVDGQTHYAEIGMLASTEEPPVRNSLLELRPRSAEPREIDRTIARVAAARQGVYSERLHRDYDPQVSGEYVASHVRRLEAMRQGGMVERLADGHWKVGEDYLDRALRYEALHRSRQPVRISVLSWQRLEDLPQAAGATWLDRQLLAKTPETLGPTGMGAEVEVALRTRRQWLIEQGLAREQEGQVRYARDLLRTLEGRELARTAADISARTGLEHIEVKAGDKLTGVYRRMLTLNSGRYALVERSHDFALVPWRPVLERARGQMVTGSVGGEGISWSIGIKRGLGL
ncbi:relaxase/mobilization nuclease RlxS [Bradyrhizobium sp. Cp5.3]|uniref:relaxase/mobilization nuclease RlxS n=1 Tax=Bradyrhizobium sp. Cp5.3 TaxID=443598 RepID=UPI0003FD5D80|nr:relaxase/mobilization nuclease RlxS [Bradyrhizobium sp. Cp5.3]